MAATNEDGMAATNLLRTVASHLNHVEEGVAPRRASSAGKHMGQMLSGSFTLPQGKARQNYHN